jgi:hypothetical protein
LNHKFATLKNTFLALLLISLNFVTAQNRSEIEYSSFFDTYYFRGPLTFNVGGGAVAYGGDLKVCPPSLLTGFGVSYKVWPRTVFGAQWNYLQLKGSDLDTTRNINFKTNLMEFYGYCKFFILDRKILKNQDVYKRAMRCRPYLTAGIGTIRYSAVSSTTNPAWDKSSKPENVHYPKYGFVVPVGAGLQFFISHRISILTEFNFRFPFTDYLDEVSARGSVKKDVYYSGELKVAYAPFAPRMKRKKLKYKGTTPVIGGGGGGGSTAEPTPVAPTDSLAAPAEPAESTPSGDAPVDPTTPTPTEKPVETPKEEEAWPADPPK